jgi:hypothetical protein
MVFPESEDQGSCAAILALNVRLATARFEQPGFCDKPTTKLFDSGDRFRQRRF